MASKPTPPGGTPARPVTGKVAIGSTRSGATGDLGGSNNKPPRPTRPPQPKTKLTPWPPTGSAKKNTRKRRTGQKWALFGLVLVGALALAYVQFGPRARDPVLVVLGGGLTEDDGRLVVTAAQIERLGTLGQVLETIPVPAGKWTLSPGMAHDLLEKSQGTTWLRAVRAANNGQARTFITILPPEQAPDPNDSVLFEAAEVTVARTLPAARPLRFSVAELGNFEVVPAGAGPPYLDGVCRTADPAPPGEWFLLYREGAPAPATLEVNSESECIDACRESPEACADCRIEQANRRTAQRMAKQHESKGRHDQLQALTQNLGIRADVARYRLSPVNESCYGLIPRHDAELIGVFVVPVQPRSLTLESPVGELVLR
ncbi:MAG: hypothetical protein IPG45_02835 [Deltaproteobacteria bacterium]|jgi:hypothetical protein|nr:hypothetical protein [Deltaproteobacteria bacterium]